MSKSGISAVIQNQEAISRSEFNKKRQKNATGSQFPFKHLYKLSLQSHIFAYFCNRKCPNAHFATCRKQKDDEEKHHIPIIYNITPCFPHHPACPGCEREDKDTRQDH
jgi:hypothetical protein